MKALIIFLLLTLSLCTTKLETRKTTTKDPRQTTINKDIRKHKEQLPPTLFNKLYCDGCVERGYCPIECADILRKEQEKKKLKEKGKYKNFCEECEKKGNCPLTCRRYFIKKQCLDCKTKGNCPSECKKYEIKKTEKKN